MATYFQISALATVLAGFVFQNPLRAVESGASNQSVPGSVESHFQPQLVPLKYVSPQTMAGWIDPTHNKATFPLKTGSDIFPALTGGDFSNLGTVALPAGVERLGPAQSGSDLVVYGSDAGVQEVRHLAASLDRPLRKVEVELQYVQITPKDVQKLCIVARPKAPGDAFTIGTPSSQTLPTLSTLLASKKAKILMAPRVLGFHNLVASIGSNTLTPVILGDGQQSLYYNPGKMAAIGRPLQYLGMEIGFTTRPTINDDGSLTIALAPGRNLSLSMVTQLDEKNQPVLNSIWRRSIDKIQIIPNMKDGETVVLMGGDSSLVSGFDLKPTKSSNLILLVSARTIPSRPAN